jgi:hypothetical protein
VPESHPETLLGYSLRPIHWQPIIFAVYLNPNSGSLQKPIEGVYHHSGSAESMQFSIYKGAIDRSEHNSTAATLVFWQTGRLQARKQGAHFFFNKSSIVCKPELIVIGTCLTIPADFISEKSLTMAGGSRPADPRSFRSCKTFAVSPSPSINP